MSHTLLTIIKSMRCIYLSGIMILWPGGLVHLVLFIEQLDGDIALSSAASHKHDKDFPNEQS